jgi:hypothetical protein
MAGTYEYENKSPDSVEGAEYFDQQQVLEVDFHT